MSWIAFGIPRLGAGDDVLQPRPFLRKLLLRLPVPGRAPAPDTAAL